ncbi:MAG: hypothetical protein IJH12_00635 [Clostridia bacterium]|nr:hypothetical protein [Clostridia bacterium]
MLEIIKILFTLVGTFIGAGFISGKEIYLFFFQYGLNGLIGIIFSSIFIGFILYKTIIISKKNNIKNYNIFFNKIIKNEIIKKIVNIYLLLSFCVMVSGFCSFINQEFEIKKYIVYFFILIIIIIVLRNNYNTIIKINNILIPIIIVFILYFFKLIFFKNNNLINFNNITNKGFVLPAILYANYNLISLIPISIINSKKIKNTKIICILFSTIIIFLSTILFFILYKANNKILIMDFPIIRIIEQYGKFYKIFYGLILGMAIITTALSVEYSYVQGNNRKLVYSIIFSFIATYFNFSKLIEVLYPIFGICGFWQCIYILKKKIK